MKKIFSQNYFKVCPNPLDGQMENRWKGIEEYCNQDEVDVLNLTTLAFGLHCDKQFLNEFSQIFQNTDMRFQGESIKELSMLACMCLIKSLEKPELILHVALSVICLSGYSIVIPVPELISLSFECFYNVSAQIREEKVYLKKHENANMSHFANSVKDLTEFEETSIAPLSSAILEILQNFKIMEENQNKINQSLQILQEDSNILSWITGASSNIMKKQLNKSIPQHSIAFIIAQELSYFVNVIPGPFSFEGFLKTMLANCKSDEKKCTLVKMIDSIDNEFKNVILNDYDESTTLCNNTPILTSLKCALDANASDIWPNIANSKTLLNINTVENTVLDWAKLMYFECILVKLKGCE